MPAGWRGEPDVKGPLPHLHPARKHPQSALRGRVDSRGVLPNRLCAQISDGTDTFGIQYQDFIGTKFWSAFSLEKAAGESVHSGTNTMGQILYVNMKGLGSAITSVHVVVVFDSVAAITSGGIEVKY